MKIRIGNDIKIKTSISNQGVIVDLTTISTLVPTIKVHNILSEQTYSEIGSYNDCKYSYDIGKENFAYTANYTLDTINNYVYVYFPAEEQTEIGIYDLVIEYSVTDTSMNKTTRTYTISKEQLFELVSTTDDSTTGMSITYEIGSDVVTTGISFLIDTITLEIVETLLNVAKIAPVYATDQSIIYASLNTSIATIDNRLVLVS